MQQNTTLSSSDQSLGKSLGQKFFDQGYLMPIDIFTTEEAASHRNELETLEKGLGDVKTGNKNQLNSPHLLFCFANAITRNEKLLDVVASIIGPDILVWGSTFFIKEPQTSSYVSWHQDMKYWGLDDTNAQVSAWIALNDVDISNGCMQFLPETHKGAMVEHKDSFDDANFLTRGQEAQFDYDPDDIVHVELKAGQASFHHGKLLHASPPNQSTRRRIGYAIQFIAPHVKQEIASKDFAMLVRGKDDYGYFELVDPPEVDLAPESIALHNHILNYQNEAMYDGANNKG